MPQRRLPCSSRMSSSMQAAALWCLSAMIRYFSANSTVSPYSASGCGADSQTGANSLCSASTSRHRRSANSGGAGLLALMSRHPRARARAACPVLGTASDAVSVTPAARLRHARVRVHTSIAFTVFQFVTLQEPCPANDHVHFVPTQFILIRSILLLFFSTSYTAGWTLPGALRPQVTRATVSPAPSRATHQPARRRGCSPEVLAHQIAAPELSGYPRPSEPTLITKYLHQIVNLEKDGRIERIMATQRTHVDDMRFNPFALDRFWSRYRSRGHYDEAWLLEDVRENWDGQTAARESSSL